jgi:hypothetical protein
MMYRWGTSGSKVVPEILEKLLPYLIVKKENAELVLEFCKGKARVCGHKEKKCRKCGEVKEKQGYGLCHKCYAQEYRHKTLSKWKKDFSKNNHLSEKEIQWREELYWKVKKLNAVGAAATTNQKETRES